jgi:hypothetical protein
MLNKYVYTTILFIGLNCISILSQERLYVFYPQIITSVSVLQQLLSEVLKQRTIKVFDNPEQFFSAVENDKPDIIITKARVISQLSGFNPILRGIKGGQKKQSYILLSLGRAQSLTNLNTKTVIGIISFSTAADNTKFVNDCIHLSTEIVTVTKPEDLITLLVRGKIDCTIVTKEAGDYFRDTYFLEFYEMPLSPDDPDIVSCAIRAGKASYPVRKEFTSESGRTIAQILGIDLWK